MNSLLNRTGNWKDFMRTSPVTSIIIIANTFMLLVVLITGGFTGENLARFGAIWPPYIFEFGEWWRLITAAFLHGSIIHFAGNVVIGLLTLSSSLERLLGSKKFSFIYFGSLILASISVLYLGGEYTLTIGASGAIFGVLGCYLYIMIYRKDMLSAQDIRSIGSLIAINLLFTLLFPGISIWGHFGGIVSGLLLSFLIIRRNVFKVIN